MAWWENDPTECFWLELTDREDVGANLRAPEANESGKPEWRYTLFKEARPGDIVFHYHKPREAVIAASLIAGVPAAQPIVWAARGTFARARGDVPHERPGYVTPLQNFTTLRVPLTVATLRARSDSLRAMLDALQERHKGSSLYFPFELGSKRELRPLQGYAFKLPRDFVFASPELVEAVDVLGGRDVEVGAAPAAALVLGQADVRGSRSSGQGRAQLPAEVKRAIELRAMEAATEHFLALGFSVRDVSRTEPYDLHADREGEVKHIEVKGTTGGAESVLLTRNEVDLARRHPERAVLFVLSAIAVRGDAGSVVAEGGVPRVVHPWSPADDLLEPLQFRYRLPSADERERPSDTSQKI